MSPSSIVLIASLPHLPLSLTAEGVVPPADRDSGALTGLCVSLNVIAKRGLHAVVFTHVINAVAQESLWRNERVTGLEAIGQDRLCTLRPVDFFLLLITVGIEIRSWVGLAAVDGKRECQLVYNRQSFARIIHHKCIICISI